MSYKFNEDQFFVHFKDGGESAFILDYGDTASEYYQLTGFAADVVSLILKNQGCSSDILLKELSPLYEASETQLKTELDKVIAKLSEHCIV